MQTLDAPTLQSLLDRLQGLRPDTPAKWGKMNAHQMLCHLSDSYRLISEARPVTPAVTFFNRTFIRWMALHTSMKWPEGVPTRPEVDQFAGGTRPAEFDADKATLVAAIQSFATKTGREKFPGHPIFGELTAWEWRRWGFLHADHHFRQFGL